MKKLLSLAAFIVLMTVLVIACKKDSENDNTPATVDCSTITTTFAGTVQPLMNTSCAKSN